MKFSSNFVTVIIFIVIGAMLACHTVCGCTNFYVSKNLKDKPTKNNMFLVGKN